MACIYRTLSNPEQANEHCDRALGICLKKLSPDHIDVATCYKFLGLAYHDLGNLEQAKEYLKKLGPGHLDVATCYNYSLIIWA